MEAIILAGGFGTRLRSIITDVPKPMAPVSDVPFLEWLLQYLEKAGFSKIILSVGHQHEKISSYFGGSYGSLKIRYSLEETPLGTGGAICRALGLVVSEEVFVLNGDTFFALNYQEMLSFHRSRSSDITLALRPTIDVSRYGNVIVENDTITFFEEKGDIAGPGLINAGVYLFNRRALTSRPFPEVFSFERDFLAMQNEIKLGGYVSDVFFTDIGVPDDYHRAKIELPKQFDLLRHE